MGKFISIPGMSYSGERNRELPRHPGATEFYKHRAETSHDASGFDVGENVMFRGDCARVLHEERDQHSGVVTTWLQRSSHSDSGTYMVRWEGHGNRGLAIRDVRKTRD